MYVPIVSRVPLGMIIFLEEMGTITAKYFPIPIGQLS